MGSYGCGFGIQAARWNVVGEESTTLKDVTDAVSCAEFLGGGYRVCVAALEPGAKARRCPRRDSIRRVEALASPKRNEFICLRFEATAWRGAAASARAGARRRVVRVRAAPIV